jgi:hypothetical protein
MLIFVFKACVFEFYIVTAKIYLFEDEIFTISFSLVSPDY